MFPDVNRLNGEGLGRSAGVPDLPIRAMHVKRVPCDRSVSFLVKKPLTGFFGQPPDSLFDLVNQSPIHRLFGTKPCRFLFQLFPFGFI